MSTYLIQLRLQRTTMEHCFVSVPVASDVLDEQPDGTGRINSNKLVALAIQMAHLPGVRWLPEEVTIHRHPIQRPKGDGE